MKKQQEEAAQKEVKALNKHPRGAIKFKNGIPALCDGRALVVDDKEDVRFADDNELLSEYIARIGEAQKTKRRARLVERQKVAAAVTAARGITPKRRSREWRHPG
jgi:hypothetical protein